MSVQWYAVWTRSRHESVSAHDLALKGMEVFFPTVERPSSRRDRQKILSTPLFPGYIFVHTAMDVDHYIRIVRSHGVVDILGYHLGHAEPVRDEEIDSIRILLEGKVPLQKHPFIPDGTLVRVRTGPFKDVVGIVTEHRGRRRIVVQVELMKQAVSCEMDTGDVEPVTG